MCVDVIMSVFLHECVFDCQCICVCVCVCERFSGGVKLSLSTLAGVECVSVTVCACVCACASTWRLVIYVVALVGVYTAQRTLHITAVCTRLKEKLSTVPQHPFNLLNA